MAAGKQIFALVLCIVVCFAAAAVGSIGTSATVGTWYKSLEQPSWQPPGWVFGPVWTLLYTLMGISLWLVWRQAGFALGPMVLFGAQLVLNAGWSLLFFSMQNPGAAFVEIVLLWLLIIATIVSFMGISQLAAALLLPYLAWVSFAATLNYTLWRMNPQY